MYLNGRLGQLVITSPTSDNLFQPYLNERKNDGVEKLGIQAIPGTKFIINDSVTIEIGKTGIYELENTINVKSLKIDDFNGNEKIIIDFVY